MSGSGRSEAIVSDSLSVMQRWLRQPEKLSGLLTVLAIAAALAMANSLASAVLGAAFIVFAARRSRAGRQ